MAFAIGTYIDLKAMGDGFARLCGVKNENGLLFHILRVASITFVMAVLMSLVMMFLAVGYTMPAGATSTCPPTARATPATSTASWTSSTPPTRWRWAAGGCPVSSPTA